MIESMTLVQKLAVWAVPVLFAITVHEVAHGWVARMLGDDTAAKAGRLTLNPFKHIDPIGTIVVPAVLLFFTSFLFGWAKPVPVDFSKLRNPKRDMAIVAAAGPAVNALMAIGWTILLKIAIATGAQDGIWMGLRYMSLAGISINLVLMVLNLIPLPPLDGGRVAVGLLPMKAAVALSKVEPYGMFIMIALVAIPGALSAILFWPLVFAQGTLFKLFGIATSTLY